MTRVDEELAEHLRQAAESWAALIAAEGEGLVSPRAGEGKAVAAGVVFDLSPWVTPGKQRSIVRAMVAAARVLEGRARVGDGGVGATIARLFGRGGERRYQVALDELGIGPPLRRDGCVAWDRPARPIEYVRAGLDAEGLTLEHAREATYGSVLAKSSESTPYARVPKDALPVDLSVFSAMVRAVAHVASAYDSDVSGFTCAKCGVDFASVDMLGRSRCRWCGLAPPAGMR